MVPYGGTLQQPMNMASCVHGFLGSLKEIYTVERANTETEALVLTTAYQILMTNPVDMLYVLLWVFL